MDIHAFLLTSQCWPAVIGAIIADYTILFIDRLIDLLEAHPAGYALANDSKSGAPLLLLSHWLPPSAAGDRSAQWGRAIVYCKVLLDREPMITHSTRDCSMTAAAAALEKMDLAAINCDFYTRRAWPAYRAQLRHDLRLDPARAISYSWDADIPGGWVGLGDRASDWIVPPNADMGAIQS